MAGGTATLPPLQSVTSSSPDPTSPLAQTLSVLFEPSPILLQTLVPQLALSLTADSPITSYSDLIDAALDTIQKWDDGLRSQFIAGHPRIGETKNLSKLSAKEQGAGSSTAPTTPPEVLTRLAHLNACYEHVYPGLRYITFVNGRRRATVAEEMEDVLEIKHSLSPDEPAIATFTPVEAYGNQWKAELDRAVVDVGRIAKSRLKALESS